VEFFEDVVHFGERQVWVRFLTAFAMSIELFAEESDALALGLGDVGKGEGIEAASLVIPGPVFQRATGGKCPGDVNAAGENAEDVSVAGGDVYEHVVRKDGGVEEDKEAVLGGFYGGDVATEAIQARGRGFRGEMGCWGCGSPGGLLSHRLQ
jgi:hypothetical protein